MTTIEPTFSDMWSRPFLELTTLSMSGFDSPSLVLWAEPEVRKINETDGSDFLWNALDSRAIGTNPPSEAHEIEVTIEEVRQGKPRALAMDEFDWEDEILLAHPTGTPVRVAVTSITKPPFVFHDEAECEDEILLPPPRMTYAVARVVSREKPPFIFIDDLETS